jgi:hypothetical protein
MEFLEEYWCPINYHLGKANAITDALSWKVKMERLRIWEVKPVHEVLSLNAEVGKDTGFKKGDRWSSVE